ncbi:M20/M25/M40 family metallo-hydrolase [Arthrobacter sp. zg-Y820]|uniref:M20/M25/M40 family metallo-hydrolase n=1 Tax=unclassified Arthrobacter TaxID=235627 RepID=UPI001E34F898|nr:MULTISPECIES: M20/M25/M40 family metallo-hydrolase [unclassified Arthrobacter]MCC9196145.1 M20/M25/M40 family metallo-hydrolase [Arthrobacter sp. zg-Y820]MDK1279005.1 M20/M25/M40 family metallo-hydrolase [Arthrobacter sp. zg.Y820]WIB08585.1 M20/M25/M40 family metallo-hydrolase [Arthrobacter sp. zg-Y820]
MKSKSIVPPPAAAALEAGSAAAAKLSRLITCRTVSTRDPQDIEIAEFDSFIGALPELFPQVHRNLTLERVNGYGLLYHWKGATPAVPAPGSGSAEAGAEANGGPLVLMAHYDVVPVTNPGSWDHPPFSGAISDARIWGRGTLDDKGALAAILQAVELLVEEGFVPARDVYLSFGNNEETAGTTAGVAAALLASRGIRPWLVLDEGGAVATQAFPFVNRPVAVVGVTEKGILDVELSTEDSGGHASTPHSRGATARLARAVVRLDENPLPASLPNPTVEMFGRLASAARFPARLVFRNMGLFRRPLTTVLARMGGEPGALTRTTVAVTQLRGSSAANVLASRATANANIRIAVGDTVEGTVRRLKRIIRDPSVSLRVVEGNEPSPVSATDNDQFALLARTITAVFPDAAPAPYVMLAGTDSRRFTGICDAVYRFAPFRMDRQARASIHGDNESLGVETFGEGILFYVRLLRSLEAAR